MVIILCKSIIGFPSKIIPHGCKTIETLSEEDAKRNLNIDSRIPIVGYCGFITQAKGIENLINAMSLVKNAALLIGGGWHAGPDTQYIVGLKSLSMKLLPERVHWLGFVEDDMLSTVYSAMRVVVYPSRYSTESGALLMALGHGKAVIASDLRPFREKGKALDLFKNIDDLAIKIRKYMESNDERKILENNARKYCIKNSWSNVADMHIKLYSSLL